MSVTVLVANGNNSLEDVELWLAFNGSPYPNSRHHLTVPSQKTPSLPSETVVNFEFIGTSVNPGDYVEIYWQASNTNISLIAEPAAGGLPASNAVSVDIAQVMNTQSGTNGTSGSSGTSGGQSTIKAGGWSWTTNYANLTNGVENYLPFDTEIFNNDSAVYELINSGSGGSTGARIHIKQSGYYEITSQMHFYDLYNNNDVTVSLNSAATSSGAMSQVTLINDCKFAELTADQQLNGTVVFNVASPGYYTVSVNPSANSPYPSFTGSAPPRFWLKKLS